MKNAYPYQESNLDLLFRRELVYPLTYRDVNNLISQQSYFNYP